MLNIDLKGRRALVAGVADDGGFGFAIAKALAEAGAQSYLGFHLQRFAVSTDAAQLDVDDAARLHIQRMSGISRRAYGFVQTKRRANQGLKARVLRYVVVRQGLLNHHQIECIHLT